MECCGLCQKATMAGTVYLEWGQTEGSDHLVCV